jgi:hypothetical protein
MEKELGKGNSEHKAEIGEQHILESSIACQQMKSSEKRESETSISFRGGHSCRLNQTPWRGQLGTV